MGNIWGEIERQMSSSFDACTDHADPVALDLPLRDWILSKEVSENKGKQQVYNSRRIDVLSVVLMYLSLQNDINPQRE